MELVSLSYLTHSVCKTVKNRQVNNVCKNCFTFTLKVVLNELIPMQQRLDLVRKRSTKLLSVYSEAHQAVSRKHVVRMCPKCGGD